MQYLQITDISDLPAIGQYAPFRVVLAIEDAVSRERREEISRWLVENGGLYIMACGEDCETWNESIRQANLDRVSLEEMKPEEFVMITTHRQEKLRSVFWHAKKHARHTHVKIQNTLTVHLGTQNRSVEYLAIFDKA